MHLFYPWSSVILYLAIHVQSSKITPGFDKALIR